MSNVDFTTMGDDAFEEMLANGGLESSTETPSESPAVSDDQVEQSTEDEVNSPEEAAEEQSEHVEEEQDAEPEEESEEETSEEQETEEVDTDTDTPEFEPITIKASGQEIEVRTEEERNRLMQMGFDYSAKMQGMKAHRKTIKTLEEHKIDEDSLNLLISAHKGDKGAIAKLIQDHKIDTMDLDGEDSGYTPTNHSVSDSQVELDDVIARIENTPSFSRTSDLVTNQWDEASKKVVFEKPEHLETLNSHIANGTFDRVMQEVNRARVFGGLQGLSDLEAYQKVGQELEKAGEFQKAPPTVVSTKPKAKKPQNADKKLRASSTRKTTPKAEPKYNYAKMSDAEFEKLLNPS